jgi:NADH-quinone oxidoreductase subunit F
VEPGTPLGAVIDAVGSGAREGRVIKAVLSGVANPVIGAQDLETPLGYETFDAIGSGLGAAGFIVYDDTACMVGVASRLSRFLSVESCGQCPPCKLGASEITSHLERLERGDGTEDDVRGILHWLGRVTDGNRCYLPVQEQRVVGSILETFVSEFAEHVDGDGCPRPRDLPMPKLVALDAGTATYDETFWRKRPDWSYEP